MYSDNSQKKLTKPVTLSTLKQMKADNDKIVVLTSYDATFTNVMNVAGVESNTLLMAQSVIGARQIAQDPAGTAQRDRAFNSGDVAQRRQTQAPQVQNAVTAVAANDAGPTALKNKTLPKDAQSDARALVTTSPQADSSSPRRGSVVSFYA